MGRGTTPVRRVWLSVICDLYLREPSIYFAHVVWPKCRALQQSNGLPCTSAPCKLLHLFPVISVLLLPSDDCTSLLCCFCKSLSENSIYFWRFVCPRFCGYLKICLKTWTKIILKVFLLKSYFKSIMVTEK